MTRLAALGLLLFALCGARAEGERRDGNWWRELTVSQRSNYMTGFFDGMDLGNNFSFWGMPETNGKLDPSVAGAGKSYSTMIDKYMKDVTNGQVADGVTKFYEDYRNRKIIISNAVWLVLNSIAGKSDDEMEKMTQNFRKYAN
jgi:hypothetical protein